MHEHHLSPDSVTDHEQFWEEHYGQSERVWSGKVNQVLQRNVEQLTPGRCLDLGSGEGADALWLAHRGWQATGVDISPTAVARANQAARDQGLDENQVRFIAADLSTWDDHQLYDLVTLSFFQAPFEFLRSQILRQATQRVAAGGHLLVLSHASHPSWSAKPEHEQPPMPTPESELAALKLADREWDIIQAGIFPREITGPGGRPAVLEDSVVLARRKTQETS